LDVTGQRRSTGNIRGQVILPVCKTEQNWGDDILSSNETGNSSLSLPIPISNENGACTLTADLTLSRPSIIASVGRSMDLIRQGLIKYLQDADDKIMTNSLQTFKPIKEIVRVNTFR
jgi:hypothetical protein